MTQNIYDTPEFFAGYSQLERSLRGLDGAAEWPVLRAMLPGMAGLRVVDLGCGFGWFCRWARDQGAADVLGLDVSANMLARARSMTSDPQITYARQDLEHVSLPNASFELAYSSLTLHYLQNLPTLLVEVHKALQPGGWLVFSAEHPIFTAPTQPASPAASASSWPLDSYQLEGPRTTDWLTKGVIKQHRTTATYVNLVLENGFILRRLIDWSPSAEQIATRPEWAEYTHRPMFLLLSAQRAA